MKAVNKIKAILKGTKATRRLPTLTKAKREWQITRYLIQGVRRNATRIPNRPTLITVSGTLDGAKQCAEAALATHRKVLVYEECDVCHRTTTLIYKAGKANKDAKPESKSNEMVYKASKPTK